MVPEAVEETFLGCAATGDRRGDEALNLRKNRIDEAAQPRELTFPDFLALPMPDGVAERRRARWTDDARRAIGKHEGRPVTIEGFVFDAKREGPEATNCHDTDERQKDFHVWVIEHASDDRARAIVVEITPRVRALHPSWTLAKLKRVASRRSRVRITGWLMFDQEHPEQLHAAAKRDATRGTLWEVHPVTRVEVGDDEGKHDL